MFYTPTEIKEMERIMSSMNKNTILFILAIQTFIIVYIISSFLSHPYI